MSADRYIPRKIFGPDWGEVPDKYAPKIKVQPVKSLSIGFMPIGRMKIRGADWGDIEDKYAPKVLQTPDVPADTKQQLATDIKTIKTSALPERSFPKTKANGAELDLEGNQGRGVVYFDANLPRPFISSIRGLKITMDRETSIGLDGRRQNRVIFEGRSGLVAIGLTQFELDSETITIKSTTEAVQMSQTKATPSQGTAA